MDAEQQIYFGLLFLFLGPFVSKMLAPVGKIVKGEAIQGSEAVVLWFAGGFFFALIHASSWMNVLTGFLLLCYCFNQEASLELKIYFEIFKELWTRGRE